MFCEIVTLALPDFLNPFIFDIDATDVSIGIVLFKLNKSNFEQYVVHDNRLLTKAERTYAVTRNKMFALSNLLRYNVVTYSARYLLCTLTI